MGSLANFGLNIIIRLFICAITFAVVKSTTGRLGIIANRHVLDLDVSTVIATIVTFLVAVYVVAVVNPW